MMEMLHDTVAWVALHILFAVIVVAGLCAVAGLWSLAEAAVKRVRAH